MEPEIPPEFEGKERVRIGQDESVRLDVVRARFRLIVTIRPKYAYKEPAAILQAPAPEHIVEAGLPTEALLAQVAVSKYADGLPLYRQEAIYARDGVELGRSLMAQWMGAVGFHFEPLAAHVLARIREGERIFADETTLPTLDPGAGKTKTAWLWAYARDDRPFGGAGPPMVAYRFEDSRSGDCAARHLGDYRGILQCDGYAGYRKLAGAPARQRPAARRMLGPPAPPVLRPPRQRRVGRRDGDGRADEALVGRRGRSARPAAAGASGGATGDVGRHRAGVVRPLGARTAAHLRQIETGRGDPLRTIPSHGPRALPRRWPRRDRLQHRRARDQAPGHYEARTRSSPDPRAEARHGRPSPPCCRPAR